MYMLTLAWRSSAYFAALVTSQVKTRLSMATLHGTPQTLLFSPETPAYTITINLHSHGAVLSIYVYTCAEVTSPHQEADRRPLF